MSTWLERARVAVRQAVADMPEDADEKALKKRFRERGSLWHGGTYWGRRAWGKAAREYLGRNAGSAWRGVDLADVVKHRPDITFPWKGESSGGA